MVTGLYQQESVDQMIAAAGTSQFTNLGFYPTCILGDALSKTSEGHTDEIEWRYGRAYVDGPTFIQSDDLQRELFDVSALDISMVAQVARDGVQRSGIENQVGLRVRATRLEAPRSRDHGQRDAGRTTAPATRTPSTASAGLGLE